MPPFCVVHANKAFCELSGLSGREIIGKPIESLLHVFQDPMTHAVSVTPNGTMNSTLLCSKRACELEMLPVTDKFQNPLGGMSHLLVKVQATSNVDSNHDIVGKFLSSKRHSIHGDRQVFGTVG